MIKRERATDGIENGFGLFATVGRYSLDEFDVFGFEQSRPLVPLFPALRASDGDDEER